MKPNTFWTISVFSAGHAGRRPRLGTPARLLSAFLAALLPGFGTAIAAPAPVRYLVTFERTWSEKTHPTDFPLLAHFSPLIGVTHGDRYSPFHAGSKASPGVEALCEEGKHQPLDAEIRSAIAGGAAGAMLETDDPIRDVPGKAVTTFEADPAHPMVSIAAMIAPSPDWCAMAAEVMLMEHGQWTSKKTITLYAWDAGTDSGTTYRAFDSDTKPRAPIQLSDAPYFHGKDGKRIPVGRVTFVRQ